MNPLFACSRCFKRYPFEEIFTTTTNEGDMLCNDCRNATAKSKCSYCRSEFQQSGQKGVSSSACPKCMSSLKQFGKPTACQLCSINAAFKSNKCARCTANEYKYGPAVKCEICQTLSAFNRDDHRIDGKLHCWLCKQSLKRALHKAKAKKSDSDRSKNKKRSADESLKAPHKVPTTSNRGGNSSSQVPEKIAKTGNAFIPNNNSDHVVLVTQLREQLHGLQKKLADKDRQLLQKDKEITEWKSKHFTIEGEMRNKQKDQERIFEAKLDVLNKKVVAQQRELSKLSKLSKKNERIERKAIEKTEKDTNTSGSDSPNNN